jgi:hypothetical protein
MRSNISKILEIRLTGFVAVKIRPVVYRLLTLCSLVGNNRRFGETYSRLVKRRIVCRINDFF